MGVIDIAVNQRTSAQNEPDLHKCYKLGYPNSGFHILQKTEICFIIYIDDIDHTHSALFMIVFCLATSFDRDYRSS
jgi:hypothetical protein